MVNDDDKKPKIVSDESWKVQAQREKEKLEREAPPKAETKGQAAPPRGSVPPADLLTLIQSLRLQALYYLGQVRDPKGGKPQVDLDLAKHHIDMLQVLEDKTKGNLTDEESRELAVVLHELRLVYVQSSYT
jgi:hypothetical protein